MVSEPMTRGDREQNATVRNEVDTREWSLHLNSRSAVGQHGRYSIAKGTFFSSIARFQTTSSRDISLGTFVTFESIRSIKKVFFLDFLLSF